MCLKILSLPSPNHPYQIYYCIRDDIHLQILSPPNHPYQIYCRIQVAYRLTLVFANPSCVLSIFSLKRNKKSNSHRKLGRKTDDFSSTMIQVATLFSSNYYYIVHVGLFLQPRCRNMGMFSFTSSLVGRSRYLEARAPASVRRGTS